MIKVVGTLHSFHRDSSSCAYEHVYGHIASFKPDYIGVEIRPEDMGRGDDYLRRFYPEEMIALKNRKVPCMDVFGFDWLGKSIENLEIPADYFKTLPVKRLENEIETDPSVLAPYQGLMAIQQIGRASCRERV